MLPALRATVTARSYTERPVSDRPDVDEPLLRLDSGEELVLPGQAEESLAPAATSAVGMAQPPTGSTAVTPQLTLPPGGQRAPRPTWRDRRIARKLRARKVRRLVRHVEPWSVLKIALIFYFCLWVILLIAGTILWRLAVSSGTVDNIETFVTELFALQDFAFNADQIFRACAIGGLVLVVFGAGFTVLMAVLFNLISDITGGARFTVVEEETARPRPKRLRPRQGLISRAVGFGGSSGSAGSSDAGSAGVGAAPEADTSGFWGPSDGTAGDDLR